MASAVAQRYRDADTIQTHRTPAKPGEFAQTLTAEPSVVATIGRAALNPPAAPRAAVEAAMPARPATRTLLPSQALAKRGTAAYEAAAALGPGSPAAFASSGAPSGEPASSGSGLSIEI